MPKKNEDITTQTTAPNTEDDTINGDIGTVNGNENKEPENKEPENKVPEREPLLEFHSPAASLAYAEGKPTMKITIRERRDGDNYRKICVGNNPPAVLPTEVEVEVVPDEYYALKNSMAQRKKNKEIKKKLQRDFKERSKYL